MCRVDILYDFFFWGGGYVKPFILIRAQVRQLPSLAKDDIMWMSQIIIKKKFFFGTGDRVKKLKK